MRDTNSRDPDAGVVTKTTATKTNSGRDTGTLGKALQVLDVIAMAAQPLRFTDMLGLVDQPRGTLHRQLSNLIEEGLVQVNADQSYSAGLRLLKLAARTWSQNTLRSIAEPHMRALQEATGETVHLGILNDLEVIYIDKMESRQTVRMHSQVGNVSPLYCTGIGKAMMALLPVEECENLAHRFSYIQHTPTTLHTPQLLLKDIENIRKTGLSHDREEHEPGIYCVAAALRHNSAQKIMGLSVTGPAFRILNDVKQNWEKLVLETAAAIEKDLDDNIGPRATE